MKKNLLLLLIVLQCSTIFAQRWWVGGNGNWSDANHWSSTNPATLTTIPSSIPGNATDVFINSAASAGIAAFSINIDVIAQCRDISTVGVTLGGTRSFYVSSGGTTNSLLVFGNLTMDPFQEGVPLTTSKGINFSSFISPLVLNGSGKTINTGNIWFSNRPVIFNEGCSYVFPIGSKFISTVTTDEAIRLSSPTGDLYNDAFSGATNWALISPSTSVSVVFNDSVRTSGQINVNHADVTFKSGVSLFRPAPDYYGNFALHFGNVLFEQDVELNTLVFCYSGNLTLASGKNLKAKGVARANAGRWYIDMYNTATNLGGYPYPSFTFSNTTISINSPTISTVGQAYPLWAMHENKMSALNSTGSQITITSNYNPSNCSYAPPQVIFGGYTYNNVIVNSKDFIQVGNNNVSQCGGTFNQLIFNTSVNYSRLTNSSFACPANATGSKFIINNLLRFTAGNSYTFGGYSTSTPFSLINGYQNIILNPGAVHEAFGTCTKPISITNLNALKYTTAAQLDADYLVLNNVVATTTGCGAISIPSSDYGANSVFVGASSGFNITTKPVARTLFWVGPTVASVPATCVNPNDTTTYGDWNDSQNWSINPLANPSNGLGRGACPPRYVDSVVFPANSYVKLNNKSDNYYFCKSMNWLGVGEITGDIGSNLNIFGSLKFSTQMKNRFQGVTLFRSFEVNNFIKQNGKPFLGAVKFIASNSSTNPLVDNFNGPCKGKWLIIDTLKVAAGFQKIYQYAYLPYYDEAMHALFLERGHLLTRDKWNLFPASLWMGGVKRDACIQTQTLKMDYMSLSSNTSLNLDTLSLFKSDVYITSTSVAQLQLGGLHINGQLRTDQVNTDSCRFIFTNQYNISADANSSYKALVNACAPYPLISTYPTSTGPYTAPFTTTHPGSYASNNLPSAYLGHGQKYYKIIFLDSNPGTSGVVSMNGDTISNLIFNGEGNIIGGFNLTSGSSPSGYFNFNRHGYIKTLNATNPNSSFYLRGNYNSFSHFLLADTVRLRGNSFILNYSTQLNNVALRVNKQLKYYPSKTHIVDKSDTVRLVNANVLYALAPCDSIITIAGVDNTAFGSYRTLYNQTNATISNLQIIDVPAVTANLIHVAGTSSSMNGAATGWDIIPATPRLLRWQDNSAPGLATKYNWFDKAHWQKAIAGSLNNKPALVWTSLGECPPTLVDSVYFDNTSFNHTNDTLSLNVYPSTAKVATFYWNVTTAGMSPVVYAAGSSTVAAGYDEFHIYDSLYITNGANIKWQYKGDIRFRGNARNAALKLAGIKFLRQVIFEADNDNHVWNMIGLPADSLVTDYQDLWVPPYGGYYNTVFFNRGRLNTNGHNMNLSRFQSATSLKRHLNLEGSIITSRQVYPENFIIRYASPADRLITVVSAKTTTVNLINKQTVFGSVFIGGGWQYASVNFIRLPGWSGTAAIDKSISSTTESYPDTIRSVRSTSLNTTFIIGYWNDLTHGPTSNYFPQKKSRFGKFVIENSSNINQSLINHVDSCYFDTLDIKGGAFFYENNKYNKLLQFAPGKSYTFGQSKVQHVGNACEFKPIGNSSFFMSMQSTSNICGNQAYLRKDSGIVCGDYLQMQGIWAVGNGTTTQTACTAMRCDTALKSSYDGVIAPSAFSCGMGYVLSDLATSGRARFQAGSNAQIPGPFAVPNMQSNARACDATFPANTWGWEFCQLPPVPKITLSIPSQTICEGDSLRVTFILEGAPPFYGLNFNQNTNSGASYPVGSNTITNVSGNLLPSSTGPFYNNSPGLMPGDTLKPSNYSLSTTTFGTPGNPYLYSFRIKPNQSTQYSLGTISVDRCFGNISPTGTGSFVVTVNKRPTGVFGTSLVNPLCSNTSAIITGTATLTGNTYYLYSAPTGTVGQQIMTSTTAGTLTTGSYTTTALTTGTTATTYTYYLGVVSANGCQTYTRSPVTITVIPTPQITNASSVTICSGRTVTLSPINTFTTSVTNNWTSTSVAGITGHSTSGSATISETLTNTTTSPLSVIYSYTPTASGCNGTVRQFTVIVSPSPLVTSANTATICSGSSVSIPFTSSSASTYSWIAANNVNTTGESLTAQTTNTLNNSIVNSSTVLQNVIYTVTPTSTVAGCLGVAQTVTVSVSPLPTVTSASTATICSGNVVSIPFAASIASSYSWIASNNVNVTGESLTTQTTNTLVNTLVNTSAVTQQVIYTVTPVSTAGSCTGIAQTLTVSVNPLPIVTANASNTLTCLGTTATLTAGGANTYTWTSGPVSSTYTTSTAGTYTVTGTNTITGCTNTRTVSISVSPLPVVLAVASSSAICFGSTSTLTATGANTYTWVAGPVSPTYTVSSSGIYTVVGTNTVTNCSNSATVSINVNSNPTLSVLPGGLSNVNCFGTSTGSIATTASGSSGYSYVWSPAISSTNTATGLNAGVYTTTVTDINGCKASVTSTISGPSTSLAIAVATNTTGCGFSNGSATVTPSGGWSSSYSYTYTGSSSTGSIVTGIPAGSYSVTVTDANGCSVIQPFVISNPSSPTLTAVVDNTLICSGSSAVITPSLSSSVSTYSLDGVAVFGSSFTVNPITTTVYNLEATDLSGCLSNLTAITISVNAVPTVTASASPLTVCSGGTINLIASGASTYTWSGSGITISNQNSANPSISAPTASVYVYVLIGTSPEGCLSSSSSVTVNVVSSPSSSLAVSSMSICQGSNALFEISNPQGGVVYTWDAVTTGTNYPVPTATTNLVGTYTINVNALLGSGTNTCTTNSTATIIVNPNPMVSVEQSSIEICSGETALLNVLNPLPSPISYLWSYNNTTGSNVTIPDIQSDIAGTYTVFITDANGCKNYATVNLLVNDCGLFIPEIYSPNGDGQNDRFEIIGIEHFPNNKLTIFNRWGAMVYQKEKYNNEWNGKPNVNSATGKEMLPAGTYFVLFDYGDGKTEIYKGYVQLEY